MRKYHLLIELNTNPSASPEEALQEMVRRLQEGEVFGVTAIPLKGGVPIRGDAERLRARLDMSRGFRLPGRVWDESQARTYCQMVITEAKDRPQEDLDRVQLIIAALKDPRPALIEPRL